mgnify:FL=1
MGIRDRLRLLVRGDGRAAPSGPAQPTTATRLAAREITASATTLAPRPVAAVPPGARVVRTLDYGPGPVCADGADEELSAALAEAFAARGVASTWVVAS